MRAERYDQKPHKKNRRVLKLLLLLILILIVSIASIVAYSYKTTEASLSIKFSEEAKNLEVGGEYYSMDYVASSVGKVTAESKLLNANTIGEKEIVYTVTQPMYGGLLNPTREFTLNYNVVDSLPPVMLWSGEGTVLERGTEFNINDVIAYGDNADPEPVLDVEGEVDMNTNGSYPLHVTVTDASGNSIDWDVTVQVADTVPVYTDTSARTQFGDFAAKYADEDRSFGIDVSTWQGDIDFEAVKKAGCDFVIIRIGYSIDGEVTIDDKFDQNFERAKAAGLRVGIYLYSYDNSEEKVRASADWIIEKLGGETLDLPIAFDWEDFGYFQTYKMSFTDLNNLYLDFEDQLSTAGYECMLYGSLNYLEKVWEHTEETEVWLAHYTDETDYEKSYMIWQQSSTGNIDGINGDVDFDIMYE